MPDIKTFLTALGLDRYCEVFVENDIDLAVAPELTEHDLEKLGLSLGHRRKFMAAAAKLGSSPEQPRLDGSPTAPDGVERRQVTVVFTDLVGSTALANKLDPEDLNQLLARYRGVCAAVIAKHGGHIAQYLGDGVLAYFGYPQAQEQAAAQAIRASLELQAVLASAGPDNPIALETRVGIATGLVVGGLSGSGPGREQTVVGSTPNLAARLQALAQPASVLVSELTRQLTGDFFEYAPAGEFELKGFDRLLPVWKVVGERKIASRFAAARRASSGPIIGRERELAFLQDSWQRAVHGNGHLMLVCGEAGMGKSRLLEAVVEFVRDKPNRLLRCQCTPYHLNSALHPVKELVRLEASLQQECAADESLQRIGAILSQIGRPSRRDLLLIAELLDVATADRVSDMDLTPAQRNAETLAILEDFLLWSPNEKPVLLLLEDAHWSDPTTQALVERLLLRVETASALVLVTHRPEFRKRWGDSAHATTIACKQLGIESSKAMAQRTAATEIGEALLKEIVERSDGVPLYIEELTKAVVDMKGSPAINVPETLHDSLMARLDRLGPSKDIALVASVIGRSFPYALLSAIAGTDEVGLRRALSILRQAGLFVPASEAAEESYSFNHSLVQEAAYENLSRSRRQALHLKVALILESQEGPAANAPEVVAYHFSRGGEPQLSCKFSVLASEKAVRRSSFLEAIANLDAALEEAGRIPDQAERARQVLDVRLRLGATFIIQAGPLSAEALAALEKAYALAKEIGAQRQLFQATWGLYINKANSRQFEQARGLGDELLDISRRLDDDDLQVEGLHHRWGYWYFIGRNQKMLQYAREGLRRYDPERHHPLAGVFAGHDLGVCAHCVEAMGLGLAGQRHAVGASVNAAVALAESLQHPTSLAFALGAGSVALHLAGDMAACGDMARQELKVVDKYDLALPRALGHFMLGLARTEQDDMDGGLALMEAHHAVTVRHSFLGVYPHVAMADALARAGRRRDALSLVTRTLETIVSPEVGLHVSELWRMRGELMLEETGADLALVERCLRTALGISEAQGATIYRERAASALGALGR